MSNYTAPPFEAYRGSDPYIFVSYAHKDGVVVYEELAKLNAQGFRIWYDEGIDPGNEWPEEIAAALGKASVFLFFVSPRAAASVNCRNEVNFALNHKKSFLAVHLEETDLPKGLALRMGDLQAIMKHRMPEEDYRRKATRVLKEYLAKAGADPAQVKDAPLPKRPKISSRLMLAGVLTVLALCVALLFRGGQETTPVQSSVTPSSAKADKADSLPQLPANAPAPASSLLETTPVAADCKLGGVSIGKSRAEVLAILERQKSDDAWSSRPLRVVLFPSGDAVLEAELQGALLKAGVRLVEREQLTKIMKEQELSQSLLGDDATRLRLGRLMAARVLLGVMDSDESGGTVSIRAVDSESSETFFSEAVGRAEVLTLAGKVAAAVSARFRLQGKVIEVQSGNLFLANIGRHHGLVTGDRVILLREGAAVLAGGKSLGSKKEKIGMAVASDLDDAFAVFQCEGAVSLKAGDLLIRK